MFGIGVEAYTVGSAEFALSYAAFNREKCIPLMDNGHYHPTEVVSDKIPALLAFFPEIALHITRPIRWDSDHVVLFDDETKEICKEIVRCGGLDGRVNIALDYFDASINRISAWTVGFRNVEKALLSALCTYATAQTTDADLSACGFDAPVFTAVVTSEDGSTVQLAYACGTDGWYLQVEGDTSVYTVDTSTVQALLLTENDLKTQE